MARDEGETQKTRFDSRDLALRAVAVLDAEGIGALTMRRMAAEMGVATTSSLYWRVRNKDDLLRLAVDEVFTEVLRNGDGLDLRSLSGHALDVLMHHPWCPPLIATHAGTGPGYAAFAERLLRALRDAGVDEDRLNPALSAVGIYVIGAAQQITAWRAAGSSTELPAAPKGSELADYLAGVSLDMDAHVRAGLDLILAAVLADGRPAG